MTANQTRRKPTGFTLVELLVALVIVSILAALSLSGLAVIRRRAKEDATRTTIRKIHEVIIPMYESYLDKRLSASAINSVTLTGSLAFQRKKLVAIRKTLAFEMPDNWDDVGSVPSDFVNGRTRSYANYEGSADAPYGSAECLYMICTLSGFEPEAMENFRAAEIGDADGDGKPEFHDAWGSPIAFIRWPTGFAGPLTLNQTTDDPFDPDNVDASRSSPPAAPFAYGVTPLIYSPGIDKEYGLEIAQAIGSQSDADISDLDVVTSPAGGHFAATTSVSQSADNITNHDLNTR